MYSPPLSTLNLNLLRVFAAIYTTRHLTRASSELQMTQPAMSHALKRLRDQMGDELFVRSPHGMTPTARADQLAPVILDALRALEEALSATAQFDASQEQRTFTVSVSDLAAAVVFPSLMPVLAEAAPGVSLRMVHSRATGTEDIHAELDAGLTDLAISTVGDSPSRFGVDALFTEPAVCAVARSHPTIRKAPSLEAYVAATHVKIVLGEEEETPVDAFLARKRLRRRVVVTTPHLAAALNVVAATDMVATVPLRTARALAGEERLRFFPLPMPAIETTVFQVWHQRYRDEPAHRWLREMVIRAAIAAPPD